MRKRFVTDLKECERLWKALLRPQQISFLWDFRLCFHKHFKWKPCFVVLEDSKGIAGMLPLSYVSELDMFVLFPGEIWRQKTWLERTPVYVRENHFFHELLSSSPDPAYLRYLEIPEPSDIPCMKVDEIGYVLYPPCLDFSMESYYRRFSAKRVKDILKVIRSFTEVGYSLYINRLDDLDKLVRMNLSVFGESSYLYDSRFRAGFLDLAYLLHSKGLLHLVSVYIDGKPTAVDLGGIYRGTYTVFLGGTDREFLGIAKLINMYHIEFAFGERLAKVDFLCGDFHWKKLWHLDPEPLYKFMTPSLSSDQTEESVNPIYPQENEGIRT